MDWEAFYNHFREPNFIPGYEIQNRLGGGAFGEVYKARKHSIGKAYAIKFLKIDDEAQRDAVERELEQVRHFAVIDHQNLVTIEDLGAAMGVPYLIMGYAGEDTLARRMKQGRLEPQPALSYFVQACRGVLALHDRRLVHFDLKPSNIFLKGDIARVGDYGLSKMMTDGRQTLSFGRGTPQYMAPEMLRNRADHRADIYSLGVILYECFAHKTPFESAVPGTLAIRDSDTPPLFPPEFPAQLRLVVERCLRLSPTDRYASVGEMLDEMGQTARPGDSVRFPALTPNPADARTPATPRAGSSTTGPPSEARQTAAEIARGAVEVARGVWDGIRTASAARPNTPYSGPPPLPPSSRPDSSSRAEPAASARSDGAVDTPKNAASKLDSSQAAAAVSGSAYAPVTRANPDSVFTLPADETPSDVMVMHTLRSDAADIPLVGMAAARASVEAASGGAATIPVPPPVKGGWLGTLFSTFALSLEVLLSLGRGVGRWLAALLVRGGSVAGSASRGLLRSTGSLVGGVLRLVLFVLLLAVLGGVTTWIAYKLLS
jgi:serine/threonine protein kinase